MKIRTGFVSNSSSSSFVVKKVDLTELQICKIKNHLQESGIDSKSGLDDEWVIEENEYEIIGHTFMDNFDMDEFLNRIGVHPRVITWGD